MKKYIFPFLYTIIIILIGSLFTSILYYFNILSDKMNLVFLYIVSALAVIIGSIKFGKELNKKGIISGIIYFLILLALMVFISLIIFKSSFSFKNIIYYVVLLLFSMMGAIIGKNKKEENDAT